MQKISFIIPGPPAPYTVWARRSRPPAGYEAMVAYQAVIQAYAKRYWGQEVIAEPVIIDTEFYLPPPKLTTPSHYSWPVRRHHDADLDNLRKAAIDALQGIIIQDDVQVVGGQMLKAWATPGSTGDTVIRVWPDHLTTSPASVPTP